MATALEQLVQEINGANPDDPFFIYRKTLLDLASEIEGGGLLSSTVIITDSEIKSLPTLGEVHTSGPVLLPAPGPGKVVLPVLTVIASDIITGYTNVHDGLLRVGHDFTDLADEKWDLTADYSFGPTNLLTDSGIVWLPLTGWRITETPIGPGVGGQAIPFFFGDNSNVEDKAVLLIGENDGWGNFTGGNAANKLTVTQIYTMIEL